MPKQKVFRKAAPSVTWAKSANGFTPHYRFRGMHALGPERPFPRYLEGERMTIARYFLCLICETMFGDSPLVFPVVDNAFTKPFESETWDNLPFMVEDINAPYGWRMNNGDLDVIGDFEIATQPTGLRNAGDHVNPG